MAENRELALVLKLVADQFQSELKQSQGALGAFNKFILDWRTQLAATGTALFAIAKSTATFGEEALKTSQRLGITVQQTTALQYAAHLADVPVQTLETSLKKLSQAAVEAAAGSGDGAKLFTALGISATDASGKIKPLDRLLFEFQDRLGAVSNQAEFVDAGVRAFGKSFLDIVPFIRQGSAATKEAMEEGKRLGVTMSGEQAQAAQRFNDELKRLGAASQGLTLQIGNSLIPTITELIKLFREIGVGTGISAGLQLIQHHVIMLTQLFKELQAGSQFLFGTGKDKMSFSQFQDRFNQIEAETKRRLFEQQHPGVLNGETGRPGGTGSGGQSTISPDLEKDAKLAKALNEIWQTGNRALEIRDKLFGEVMAKWDERAQFFAQAEQREKEANERRAEGEQALREFAEAQFKADDEMLAHAAKVQEARGRMIVEQTQLEVRLREQALAEEAEANRTFFDEWADGMRRYVRDTKTGLGFGADMARRTAQTMEQGFRTFFFDVMDGKIKSFKDVFSSLLQFVKQIMSQIASQLVTSTIIRAGLSGFGGSLGAATGGQVLRRYAMGGPVLGSGISDTVPALLTPGEYVLSRRDVQEIKSGAAGGAVSIQINNYGKSEVQASDGGRGPDGNRLIYITVREAARAAFANGDMNKTMQQQFGLTPSPVRR